MVLKKINVDEVDQQWNHFILKMKDSDDNELKYSIAHNPCLANIFKNSFGYEPEYYFVSDNEILVGVLPGFNINKQFVSIPIFPTAGFFTHNPSEIEKFYSRIPEQFTKYEIRSYMKFGKYVYDKKIVCRLNLKNTIDDQFQAFSSKLRSDIRKGYKNNIRVIQGGTELLNDFYSIYSTNMHQIGSPVHTKIFFNELVNNYENGLVRIFIAIIDDKPIGCGLLLTYGRLAELGWASTISEFNKYKPNMVLYWEVIKYCIENSFKVFSFGRATKGSGSHNFKRQWGVTELPIFFNYSSYRFDIRRLKFLSFLWRKVPSQFANKIGPSLRRASKI